MSTPIVTNTEELQEILQAVYDLPNAGGDSPPVIEGDPVAKIGEREFYTVEDALASAAPGETVVMIADSVESAADLLLGSTLDLAGYKLTANSLTAMRGANIEDNSSAKTGMLFVPRDRLSLRTDNTQLPLWNEADCYFFVNPLTTNGTYQYFSKQSTDGLEVGFRPSLGRVNNGDLVRTKYLTNGGANNGLTIVARVSWLRADGVSVVQNYPFADSMFGSGFGGEFVFSAGGYANMSSVDFNVVLTSDTGVEFVGETLTWTNPNT